MSSTAQNIKRWMYMYYVSKINKQSLHMQKYAKTKETYNNDVWIGNFLMSMSLWCCHIVGGKYTETTIKKNHDVDNDKPP